MTLKELGYTDTLESCRKENGLDSFQVGRVISEHKERYVVKNVEGEYDAELVGNLRFTAESRYDFPAVGDWVAISEYDEDKALIHAVFPRHSIIERRAVGKAAQKQIIATNVDVGLIVQAVDRDFSLNRLERYLTICNAAKISPVILLSKIDLISEPELDAILKSVQDRIKGIQLLTISSEKENGYDQLKSLFNVGKTYCLLGSSGVGKSTLLNQVSGREQMKTGEINTSINRGKHVTSHREIIILDNGGIIIDNPGMREVGIGDSVEGVETTFEAIVLFSKNCKFSDCTHMHEEGCAVLEAIDSGEIDEGVYSNYLKLMKEQAHLETSLEDKKKRDKRFGKLMKHVIKHRKENKY